MIKRKKSFNYKSDRLETMSTNTRKKIAAYKDAYLSSAKYMTIARIPAQNPVQAVIRDQAKALMMLQCDNQALVRIVADLQDAHKLLNTDLLRFMGPAYPEIQYHYVPKRNGKEI